MDRAVIISQRGEVVAVVENPGTASGTVEYAWEASGKCLVNARIGKLSRAKRYLGSVHAFHCRNTARLITDETIYPRFLIIETMPDIDECDY